MSLLIDIINGQHDEELSRITEAVHQRKDILSQINFYNFKVGDRVRFTSTVRPQYLAGIEGTIIKKLQKKVLVNIPERVGRFRGSITTPINLIEKIPDEPTS